MFQFHFLFAPKENPFMKLANSIDSIDQTEEKKIMEIIKNITLKCPRNSFTQFVLSEVDSYKKKNNESKINFQEFQETCANKWKKMKEEEKTKYYALYKEEKIKYKLEVENIKHYLFHDYDLKKNGPPTDYQIFLGEKLREGLAQGLEPDIIKKEAAKNWSGMTREEKNVYKEKKKENDNWFLKAEKIGKITPVALFIQEKVEEAKNEHKLPPTWKDIHAAWKNLTKEDKGNYIFNAKKIKEDYDRLRDLFQIVHGIRPKKPAGAFRIFLQEKAKNDEIISIKQGHNIWRELSEDQKEEYLAKSHKCLLAYMYKKMIREKKIKKMKPKRPQGPFHQFLKKQKWKKIPEGINPSHYWKVEFDGLSKEDKEKYELMAIKDRERYQRQMIQFKDKIFDIPKKPKTAYILFCQDKLPPLKKEKPYEPLPELIKKIAEEWNHLENEIKNQYKKNAEKEKKRFKIQLKEFKKMGYYTKDQSEKEDEAEDKIKDKKSQKKKSSSNVANTKKSKK